MLLTHSAILSAFWASHVSSQSVAFLNRRDVRHLSRPALVKSLKGGGKRRLVWQSLREKTVVEDVKEETNVDIHSRLYQSDRLEKSILDTLLVGRFSIETRLGVGRATPSFFLFFFSLSSEPAFAFNSCCLSTRRDITKG